MLAVASLDDVVGSLFAAPGQPGRDRGVTLLDDGVVQVAYHVEYPEDDHVYLVTVRQVQRIVLPMRQPVGAGDVAGVPVELVRVAVANQVEVTFDAAPGPARDAAFGAFEERYRRWEQDGGRGQPPPWPAEQIGEIPLAIADEVGTVYRRHCGQAGGHGTEFAARWAFLPVPPARATRLTVRFTAHAGEPIEVELPLPRAGASD